MPLQETSGNVTTDAYGGGKAAVPNYIEDVFSTYLYTGTGASNTINNGLDESTKGALTWIKERGTTSTPHMWFDTNRGVGKYIQSNSTGSEGNIADTLTAFNTNGFTLGADSFGVCNASGKNYASWTFRKQPKFFDVVTYTGNGAARTIAHSLGSVPGCVLIKCTSLGGTDWMVFHRSASTGYLYLNSTPALMTAGAATFFGNGTSVVAPDATSIYLGSGDGQINQSSATYVAYLFADNAGGFGLTGTDNVISCGSYTTDASGNATVNLGYEPQFVMWKASSTTGGWNMLDNMRGFTVGGSDALLNANSSSAETSIDLGSPTSTGFTAAVAGTNATYIYIAIRRGPMKVPTDATKVFSPALYTGTGSTNTITSPFPSDLLLVPNRAGQFYSPSFWDRLRGATKFLRSPGTDAEATSTDGLTSFSAAQNSVAVGADATYGNINFSGRNYVPYFFRRAPSFFDEVCYTGTGVARTVTHNLGVVPELMIAKVRSVGSQNWPVYSATLGASQYVILDQAGAAGTDTAGRWGGTAPTSTVFSVGATNATNGSGNTYVWYGFATCPGVSKVGSYTGNGSTQTINCGFTGGARFVLLKATSTTGNWMVYDTARGMTTLTDPFLSLNSTSAETATLGACTTVSTGFSVNESILAGVNTNGVSFVYLAIA